MTLKKAAIIVIKSNSQETIEVLFNPSEYQIDANNNYHWHVVPGLQAPIGQFINGDASSLTMDIFFDTSETGEDVRIYTTKITGLLDVDKDMHAPPICRFVWGSLNFKGIVERVNQRFTMFLNSGIPVRATLNVTFRSVQSMKEQYQNIPRQSADRTKQRILKQGEQLWMLASDEYEDPGMWRAIAKANGIANPRRLEVGKKMIIPRLE